MRPPESADRDRQELGLLVTHAVALTANKGYASPDVGEAFARARELCHRIGNIPQLFPVLHGLTGTTWTGRTAVRA